MHPHLRRQSRPSVDHDCRSPTSIPNSCLILTPGKDLTLFLSSLATDFHLSCWPCWGQTGYFGHKTLFLPILTSVLLRLLPYRKSSSGRLGLQFGLLWRSTCPVAPNSRLPYEGIYSVIIWISSHWTPSTHIAFPTDVTDPRRFHGTSVLNPII
jgi:hypothetical protein